MKYLALLGAVVMALIIALPTTAQEAPEPTPLQSVCNYLMDFGELEGLAIRNCRRTAPDEVTHRGVTVRVRLATNQGPVELEVRVMRSPWQVINWR